MNGLAAAMAGSPLQNVQTAEPAVVDGRGQQVKPMADIQQIAELLMQGVSPEDLVQNGVPVELIQAAMELISKQQTSVPAENEGLAGMYGNQRALNEGR